MDDPELPPPHHPHSLSLKHGSFSCAVCPFDRVNEDTHYFCETCNARFHLLCSLSSPKIIHPYHPTHPLTLLRGDEPDYTDGKCCFCKEDSKSALYHCSICDFTIHLSCAMHLKWPLIDHPECHEHKLGLFWGKIYSACDACGMVNDMRLYKCIQCDFVVHEDCIYLPHVLNMTRHRHPLSLTYSLPTGEWFCEVCRRQADRKFWAYSCNQGCAYVVHLRCAMMTDVGDGLEEEPKKPDVPMDPVVPPIHPHPLLLEFGPIDRCDACDGFSFHSNYYYCRTCHIKFHRECAESSREIKHPFHPRHPLTLLTSGPPDYSDGKCHLCGTNLRYLLYHCSTCNFSVDPFCAREPPPLVTDHPKCHEHRLTLFPRQASFACNACGLAGDRYPFVCIECDFMVHEDCIHLPCVIRITRHQQHRLSHTSFLPRGEWSCGVCHKEIDVKYGEYSCSKGCSYAVHSKCATRKDVWDGKDLEGEPEDKDETEDVKPFKVTGDRLINHCSHKEHDLKLEKDSTVSDENKYCEACILPVSSDPFYSCSSEQCRFVLHKKCASHSKKIWNVLHRHPLTLSTDHIRNEDLDKYGFTCTACGQECSGFKYKCLECAFELDTRCSSIPEPFIHEGHLHPLFIPLDNNEGKKCAGCGESSEYMLSCLEPDCFALDFKCATLPYKVRYKYDEHPLTLCYGEEVSGCNVEEANAKYWCEICEEEIDRKKWFYACDDCGVTSHVECARGSFPSIHVKSGQHFTFERLKFEMAANNRVLQQLCYLCHRLCRDAMVAKKSGPMLDAGGDCRVTCHVECAVRLLIGIKELKKKKKKTKAESKLLFRSTTLMGSSTPMTL